MNEVFLLWRNDSTNPEHCEDVLMGVFATYEDAQKAWGEAPVSLSWAYCICKEPVITSRPPTS